MARGLARLTAKRRARLSPPRSRVPRSPGAPGPASAAGPSVALALGGGGARGLAHICVLEAFDEIGVRPRAIAGASMGAIIGAAYAAGIPARELRAHVLARTRRPTETLARLLRARVGRVADLLKGFGNPVLIDAEIFLDLFWPESVPDRFEQLAIPFSTVAADLLTREAVVFDAGPLAPAVAASMAIPGLIRPIATAGGMLVDGGAVNPLPHDLLIGRADRVFAVDVTYGPAVDARSVTQPFEAMFAAAQVMQGAITAARLKAQPPDLVLRPDVAAFRVLDFFKAKEIFARADAVKDEVKRAVEAVAQGRNTLAAP